MKTATLPLAGPPRGGPFPERTADAAPAGAAVGTASTSGVASGARGRLGRFLRGARTDPPWARPALLALLAGTAGAYLVNLTSAGWANAFYSAAVQAGADSWSAFFWGSLDASNAITVDKPPAALWVMALSVRVFGLSSFAILLPQVLMGVGTVAVVHATVRRHFGHGAALLAGATMALTPVAVLMFRFNNPDALLTLLMALAVWAALRAVEGGSIRWMVLAGLFTGLGFLTKSMQVLLVLPALALVWLVCADTTVRRRLLGGLAAVATLLASAGWWVAIVELVPASMRPYVGGSRTDSFLELTLGYNGLDRLNGSEAGSVARPGPNSGTGWVWRLVGHTVAGQASWLLPTAVLLLVAGLWFRGRAPRTDGRRAAYLVMGAWLGVTGLTFSLMQGIFHEYYTVALAPPIAALVGMGVGEAWERRHRASGAAVLGAASATSAVWACVVLSSTSAYGGWLRVTVLVVGLTASGLLLLRGRLPRRAVGVAGAAAVLAALAGPAAYSATTLSTAHSGSIVMAGPTLDRGRDRMPGGMPGAGPPGAPLDGGGPAPAGARPAPGMRALLDARTPNAAVVESLRTSAGSYTWAAAAVGSTNAAALQLSSRVPVLMIGGFTGSDPSPTLARFEQEVSHGRIHYFLGVRDFGGLSAGPSSSSGEITTWVTQHFTEVTIGGLPFYDLTQPLAGASS